MYPNDKGFMDYAAEAFFIGLMALSIFGALVSCAP